MPAELRGLYAITEARVLPPDVLIAKVLAAIQGGARLIQYRDKTDDRERRRREASALQDLCRRHGVPLIINDDPGLTLEIGAAGVHLGRDDPDVEAARRRLGPRALVGVSCYDSLNLALEAEHAGADYVAFGSVFASSSKPVATRAPLSLLGQARERLQLPICAIGGIDADNAARVAAAGADMAAVISGVFGQRDIRAAASAIAAAFRVGGDIGD
jgi:thiamine-phosphate pyrophosphorylase